MVKMTDSPTFPLGSPIVLIRRLRDGHDRFEEFDDGLGHWFSIKAREPS